MPIYIYMHSCATNSFLEVFESPLTWDLFWGCQQDMFQKTTQWIEKSWNMGSTVQQASMLLIPSKDCQKVNKMIPKFWMKGLILAEHPLGLTAPVFETSHASLSTRHLPVKPTLDLGFKFQVMMGPTFLISNSSLNIRLSEGVEAQERRVLRVRKKPRGELRVMRFQEEPSSGRAAGAQQRRHPGAAKPKTLQKEPLDMPVVTNASARIWVKSLVYDGLWYIFLKWSQKPTFWSCFLYPQSK